MAEQTEKVFSAVWFAIHDNAAEIEALKKMMDKVVVGMDDLTARIEQLEKKK
ncbi:hypothetical protein LCGC14_1007560 [marine sediment metagenome]|uniref:Uncharacterized protein n=1 Tax=marine sediment metagenome TaxID=412755 RepID=A0A0F9R7F8_9ZZZZ